MPFNINEFKSQLVGGGARPTLFQVQITNPINGTGDNKLSFMAKATSLPGFQVGSYVVPYFGRQVKFGCDKVFEDWPVTIINDEDFLVRNALEAWNNAINTHESNERALPQNYKSQGEVVQYSKDGRILRKYVFDGIFPVSIDSIPLSWETVDTIEEFNVTFQYDLFRVEGITGISTT